MSLQTITRRSTYTHRPPPSMHSTVQGLDNSATCASNNIGANLTIADTQTIQAKSGCSCGGGCSTCASSKIKMLEREADAAADQVMRKAVSSPLSNTDEEPMRNPARAYDGTSLNSARGVTISSVQSQTQAGVSGISPDINNEIEASKSGGQPLSSFDKNFFEPRFGSDFSSVRIHDDTQAAKLSSSINARAFTIGNHIFFASGERAPSSYSGKHLLAHELTHVIQQNGAASTVQRQESEAEGADYIELCFSTVRQFDLDQIGSVHAILNIHQGNRVTRVEVDPSQDQGVLDPAAAIQSPARVSGMHSHVVVSSSARTSGSCQSISVSPAEAAAAISAASRYEVMDIVYEPTATAGPNSNSFGEWVLHEAGVDTTAILVPSGSFGWGWYLDSPDRRSSPPRVARSHAQHQQMCTDPVRPANSFQTLIDLVRNVETELIACGISDVGERLNLIRGVFYGTPWSRDYGTSQGSHARNQMFNVYSTTLQPRNPLECISCGLYLSLADSQDIQGNPRVDVGHMLIGMDARRSSVSRTRTQPIGHVTGLEAVTWAGDLGGGAAQLAMARRLNSSALATSIFTGSDYGGSINLEGDVAGYAAGASPTVAGDAPLLTIPAGKGVADVLEAYLLGSPAGSGGTRVAAGWNSRCTTFLTAMGGTFDHSGNLSNRSMVLGYLSEQIHDFGCWYLAAFESRSPLSARQMIEASRHMEGSANEIAEVFLMALEHCHKTPGDPLAAPRGSAPTPTAIGSSSCSIALSPQYAEVTAEDAARLLEQGVRDVEPFFDAAGDFIHQGRQEALRWWDNL